MFTSQGGGNRRRATPSVPSRAFSFRAIAPSLTRDRIGRFLSIDRAAQAAQVTLTQAELSDFVAYGLALRKPDPHRLNAAIAAADLMHGPWVGRSVTNEIRRANTALCSCADGSGAWRNAQVWIGRVPRERSVFEGASPKDVPRFMCIWSKLHDLPMPLSLLLAISSLRLLQIHPFLDGNGRTTRWMALRLARRHSIAPNGFDSLILSVWRKGAAFRHACSASVIEEEDWEPWLDAWSR